MYVKFQNTLPVQLENGFDRDTPVFREVPHTEVEAWEAEQKAEQKPRTELAEAKHNTDEATKQQQFFDLRYQEVFISPTRTHLSYIESVKYPRIPRHK